MAVKELRSKEDLGRELAITGDKFLLFYSAWDPFSLDFIPAFEKLAASTPGAFYKISSDEQPELADLFSIVNVPAVIFFRSGKMDRRLDGKPDKGLTAENLAEFIWLCRGVGKHG